MTTTVTMTSSPARFRRPLWVRWRGDLADEVLNEPTVPRWDAAFDDTKPLAAVVDPVSLPPLPVGYAPTTQELLERVLAGLRVKWGI